MTHVSRSGPCAALRSVAPLLAACRRCCGAEEQAVTDAALHSLAAVPWPAHDAQLLCTLLTSLLDVTPTCGRAAWDAILRDKLAAVAATGGPRCGALCAQLALRWCHSPGTDVATRQAWHAMAWHAVCAAAAWEADGAAECMVADSHRVLGVLVHTLRDEFSADATQLPGDDRSVSPLEQIAMQHVHDVNARSCELAAAWCILLALPRHGGEHELCRRLGASMETSDTDGGSMRAAMRCSQAKGLGAALVTAAWRWYGNHDSTTALSPDERARHDTAAMVIQQALWNHDGWRCDSALDSVDGIATPAGIVAAALTQPARVHVLAAVAVAAASADGEAACALAKVLLPHASALLIAACALPVENGAASCAGHALGTIFSFDAEASAGVLLQLAQPMLAQNEGAGVAATACICAIACHAQAADAVSPALAAAMQHSPATAFPILLSALDATDSKMHPSLRDAIISLAHNAVSNVVTLRARTAPMAVLAAACDSGTEMSPPTQDAVIAHLSDDALSAHLHWLAPALGCVLRGAASPAGSALSAAVLKAVTHPHAVTACLNLDGRHSAWRSHARVLQCMALAVAQFMSSPCSETSALKLLHSDAADASQSSSLMDTLVAVLTLHAALAECSPADAPALPGWFATEGMHRCWSACIDALQASASNEGPSSPAASVAWLARACAQRLEREADAVAITMPLSSADGRNPRQRIAYGIDTTPVVLVLPPSGGVVESTHRLAALAARLCCCAAIPRACPHMAAQALMQAASEVAAAAATPSSLVGHTAPSSSRRRAPASATPKGAQRGNSMRPGSAAGVVAAALAAVSDARASHGSQPPCSLLGESYNHHAALQSSRTSAMHVLQSALKVAAKHTPSGDATSALCSAAWPHALATAVLHSIMTATHAIPGANIFARIKRGLPTCPVACTALLVAALMHWDAAPEGGALEDDAQTHGVMRQYMTCLHALLSSAAAVAEGIGGSEGKAGQPVGRIVAGLMILSLFRGTLGAPAAVSGRAEPTAHELVIQLLMGDSQRPGLLSPGTLVLQGAAPTGSKAPAPSVDGTPVAGAPEPSIDAPQLASVWELAAPALSEVVATATQHSDAPAIDDEDNLWSEKAHGPGVRVSGRGRDGAVLRQRCRTSCWHFGDATSCGRLYDGVELPRDGAVGSCNCDRCTSATPCTDGGAECRPRCDAVTNHECTAACERCKRVGACSCGHFSVELWACGVHAGAAATASANSTGGSAARRICHGCCRRPRAVCRRCGW